MTYRHIFFDLDHTIWDFDKNAEETLRELYLTHSLEELGLTCPTTFIETYTRNNHELWASYHLGKITKDHLRETRFRKTFIDLGLTPELIPLAFEEDYVRICPTKTNLFPKAHEVLSYLQNKYSLHLISNGFKESTELKIEVTGLGKYFDNIVISEVIGVNKPNPAIFEFALDAAGARKEESIMIGDSIEADIRGAMAFGMDAIFFNPFGKEKPDDIKHQIVCLEDLMKFL
ncbi:YjjG family noncanonical pyrimidine nucleotidase [Pedobacter sp. SYSU D00535]|uniref:YjjG family noncanonical pyrimidine nucleotidase n=1 Tax=Pedobacter sp. SYSU D00535 TaxID=2810308 RepID=UPI001A95B9BF|nr:YjjG family noncanonical pyrimidine nucleotidase [Pedobacter sp. SYSU D00535]